MIAIIIVVFSFATDGNTAALGFQKKNETFAQRVKEENQTIINSTARLHGGLCMPCASGDYDCPENLICSQRHCVLEGRTGDMCPGLMCEKCRLDQDCAGMLRCISGQCVGAKQDLLKCDGRNGFRGTDLSKVSGLCGPCVPNSAMGCAGSLKCVAHHCVHLPLGATECGLECKQNILRKCSHRGHCAECDGATGPCADGHKCINGYCVRNGLRVESCVPARICETCGWFRSCIGQICGVDGSNCQSVQCHSGYCAVSYEHATTVCGRNAGRRL